MLEVVWHESESGLRAEIVATESAALRALLFELDYDSSRWLPLQTAGLGPFASADAVSLSVLDRPGTVYFGTVLPRAVAIDAGMSAVAQVSFIAAAAGREASASPLPPMTTASRAELDYREAEQSFSWEYSNSGDYDQNGEVNIADLVPLAAALQRAPDELEWIDYIADGNEDGQISISDLSAIGANFKARVDSYRLYSSDSSSDYPAEPGGINGEGSVLEGSIEFGEASVDPGSLRLSFTLPGADFSGYRNYWLRPCAGDSEGIPGYRHGPGSLDRGIVFRAHNDDFITKDILGHFGGSFAAVRHSLVIAEGETRLNVYVDGASAMHGLVYEFSCDLQRYEPAEYIPSGAMEAGGICYYRVVPATTGGSSLLLHTDPRSAAGLEGDHLLFSIILRNKAAEAGHTFSMPENPPLASLPLELEYDEANQQLTWLYSELMDGDQNSEVNIADVTPVMRYPDQPASDTQLAYHLMDGNRDGFVDPWDFFWIAEYFGRRVPEYSVVRSTEPGDYLLPREEALASEAFATVVHSAGLGGISPSGDPLRLRFELPVMDFDRGYYYWVIPRYVSGEDSSEGPPSNLIFVPE